MGEGEALAWHRQTEIGDEPPGEGAGSNAQRSLQSCPSPPSPPMWSAWFWTATAMPPRTPAGLCCPSTNDPKLLAAVPAEILERDYGLRGPDPARQRRRDRARPRVGSREGLLPARPGRRGERAVIGVDMNDEMLALSRRHLAGFRESTGLRTSSSGRVAFRTWRSTSRRTTPGWPRTRLLRPPSWARGDRGGAPPAELPARPGFSPSTWSCPIAS